MSDLWYEFWEVKGDREVEMSWVASDADKEQLRLHNPDPTHVCANSAADEVANGAASINQHDSEVAKHKHIMII